MFLKLDMIDIPNGFEIKVKLAIILSHEMNVSGLKKKGSKGKQLRVTFLKLINKSERYIYIYIISSVVHAFWLVLTYDL